MVASSVFEMQNGKVPSTCINGIRCPIPSCWYSHPIGWPYAVLRVQRKYVEPESSDDGDSAGSGPRTYGDRAPPDEMNAAERRRLAVIRLSATYARGGDRGDGGRPPRSRSRSPPRPATGGDRDRRGEDRDRRRSRSRSRDRRRDRDRDRRRGDRRRRSPDDRRDGGGRDRRRRARPPSEDRRRERAAGPGGPDRAPPGGRRRERGA